MHKVIITEPAGVVINTRLHKEGEILNNVPPGIAKGLLHFKQAREIGASSVRTTADVGGGSPQEDFTRKLKLLLVDQYEFSEKAAAELIKANADLVGENSAAGDVGLNITARYLAVVSNSPVTGSGGATKELMHPASRIPMVAGAGATGSSDVLVSKQPAANLTGTVAVGGGEMATAAAGALPDGGAAGNGPSQFQRTEAEAETAAVEAAADKPLPKSKPKSK